MIVTFCGHSDFCGNGIYREKIIKLLEEYIKGGADIYLGGYGGFDSFALGCCMDYEAIFDENGNEVRTHWFRNKWGGNTIVGNGVFASSESALLKKTGWTRKTIRVPAWTKFVASGYGMSGVMSGSTQVIRWHTNMVTGEYVGYPD